MKRAARSRDRCLYFRARRANKATVSCARAAIVPGPLTLAHPPFGHGPTMLLCGCAATDAGTAAASGARTPARQQHRGRRSFAVGFNGCFEAVRNPRSRPVLVVEVSDDSSKPLRQYEPKRPDFGKAHSLVDARTLSPIRDRCLMGGLGLVIRCRVGWDVDRRFITHNVTANRACVT